MAENATLIERTDAFMRPDGRSFGGRRRRSFVATTTNQANTAANLAPCALAWVVPPEVEGAMLMIPQFRQVYEAAGRNIAFFETQDAAQAWIRIQLQEAKKGALDNSATAPAAD